MEDELGFDLVNVSFSNAIVKKMDDPIRCGVELRVRYHHFDYVCWVRLFCAAKIETQLVASSVVFHGGQKLHQKIKKKCASGESNPGQYRGRVL